jgi:hypothetical protein
VAVPGDKIVVDGTEFIAGEDLQWHPNTSLLGQAAQAVTIDAPMGLLSLLQKGMNATSYPGTPEINFVPSAQKGYEALTRKLGINVAPPQTMAQRMVRAGTGGLESAPLALATGGMSIPAAVVSGTGSALAAQGIAELGGGPGAQFVGSLATDLLTSRSPNKTAALLRDSASVVANARKINAWKLIKPLDLVDEGSASMMRAVDDAHIQWSQKMDMAYKAVGKEKFPVSGNKLVQAYKDMLEEAGSINSPRAPAKIMALMQEKLQAGNGTIDLPALRTLQKDANALLESTERSTGLKQQQGMIRSKLIPAIQATLDDMVAHGEAVSQVPSGFGSARSQAGRTAAAAQSKSVDALRKANATASKYYELFDARSEITNQLVEGISGGQRLDPHAAFTKIFSDPKDAVKYSKAIMEIVGDNPKNAGMMRRTLVESVIGSDPERFSARTAHTNFNKMRFVADEVLGKEGAAHFKRLLVSMEKNQAKAARLNNPRVIASARGVGAVLGYMSGGASPWLGGLIGVGMADTSLRTYSYLQSHFGSAAAEQLAKDAFFDPSVYRLLETNISRFNENQLAQLNSAARRSLIRTGFRFNTFGATAPEPMLPSEMNQAQPSPEDLARFTKQ